MKLWLVRHGETLANQQRRYLGWSDPPLTEQGLAQAAALARRLAEEPIRLILTSDLRRARQTAAQIATALLVAPITDPRLREVNFGAFEGLTYDEIAGRYPQELHAWLSNPEQAAPPGGETLTDLRERLLAAIEAIQREPGAIIITHGGPIRTLLAHFTGRPFWEPVIPPGSLTLLDL